MDNTDDLTEYSDPVGYDLENPDFEPEGPFYLGLARRTGGPLLELGCGTGRFTIPLAREGFEITGLDYVSGMLEWARRKAGELLITWIQADAREFALGRRFTLIFESGATFQHMLTHADQLAFLGNARAHLAPDGLLVVSALRPVADLMTNEEDEYPWYTYKNETGQDVHVSGRQTYNPQTQVRTEIAVRRWRDPDGRPHERVAALRLRLTDTDELEPIARESGLTVMERYGDFDGSLLSAESRFAIFVCRLDES